MKIAILVLAVIAVGSADQIRPYFAAPTSYYRTPALDSSYVESSRFGGNFAYRTVEGHAYQAVTPLAYAAYPSYPSYPAYPYLQQLPFAAPANYFPYQPAFIEQPFGMKPTAESAPAEQRNDEGRQSVDEDTVAVESA